MVSFITRRLMGIIPMILVITFLIYLGLELTPGDAVSHLLDPEAIGRLTPDQLAALRDSFGLNDPFIIRYFRWLLELVKGNFGYSIASGVAISEILLKLLPATLELSLAAILYSTVVGSILGLISALRRGTILDSTLTVAGMIGVSIPLFFLGSVCILFFSLNLGWLPAGGRLMPWHKTFLDRLPHLILPAFVLGTSMTAGVMRYTRSSMLDAMNKEYIKTARSKGLPEWYVNLVHGFRVALTPVVVLIGFRLPSLIGGSVVVESIFQWPGVGSAFVNGVRAQNYPLVMIIALFTVLAVLLASFLVDIVTALLDPRVKLD